VNPQKIRDVVALYKTRLEEMGITPRQMSHSMRNPSIRESLSHCYYMLNELIPFMEHGRTRKMFKWLGFVQSAFWICGIYTIEELKEHNRP
jgi:hypothetical protein